MTVNTSFKHMRPSDAIKAYAKEKSEKLKKYFNGRIAISWNFTIEKQTHIAHCHLVGNHMDYFAEASTEDGLYAAIDLAVDKVEKQIHKHKEIVKNHLHRQRVSA